MTEGLASVRRDGGAFALRLERTYDAAPDEVWEAFTEPESIRRWLFADAILEPRVGGRAKFRWEDDGAVGVVREWDPPRVLELSWAEDRTATIVRVEITPAGAGSLLVLDHSNLAASGAVGLGAGWHAHLVALGDVLAGRAAIEDRWEPLYRSLRPEYDRLVGAA
jgi:uncharacterized protein YndB with AHSA1/START domain